MNSFGVLTTTMSVSDRRTIIVSRERTTRLHQFFFGAIEGKNLFIYLPYGGYLDSSIKNIILVNTSNQTLRNFNVIRILRSSAYVLAEFENEVEGKSYFENIRIPGAEYINDNSGVIKGFIVFE
jgi:hypothetical protein